MRNNRETKRQAGAGATTDEQFLTKPEVAERLQISVRTLEKWMRQRRIPFFKIGRSVRFEISDLVAHLRANSRIP